MSEPFAITGAYAAGGTNAEIYENGRHVVAVDATNPSVVFHNTRNGTDGPAFTVKTALWASPSLSFGPAPIDYRVMTWPGGSDAGKRSPAIAAGSYLESQSKAVNGLAAGNLLMTRHHEIYASPPAFWLGNELTIYAGDEVGEVGNGLTDRVDTYGDYGHGVYSYPAGGYQQYSGPSLVLGDSTTRKARIAILNDSIGMGSGEGAGGLWVGWPQRALQANYPWYLLGNQGYALATLMNSGTEKARRLALLDLAGITHVLVQTITNDLGAGATATSFMASVDALATMMAALPLQPQLILTTSTPRTNAANNAQATTDGAGVWANRLALNDAIRAQTKYACLDVAAYAQDSSNPNIWDTVGGKGTADGIHPVLTTHQAIAAGVATELAAALSVDRYA
ncbi:MAG TPA: SGNH/GDSL hydrolase family protein [Devosiaceae bacterium]|nr:SGNH/GDSL hydrolase family protein [Devosiaceae bacterium]